MSSIAVILSVWRRPHLDEQLAALREQTLPATRVYVYTEQERGRVRTTMPGVEYVDTTASFGVFGRFLLPLALPEEYTLVLDDDLIPGRRYLETVAACHARHDALVCAGGLRLWSTERYEGVRFPSYEPRAEDVEVDVGTNAYFFSTAWSRIFWSHAPVRLDNGEDIHFSAALALAGIRTFAFQWTATEETANGKPSYGKDDVAMWRRADHAVVRSEVCREWGRRGWRPGGRMPC